MAWYDVFSRFYDRSLEQLYAEHHELAAEALDLGPGMRVLDVPCGTGQGFASIVNAIGPNGALLGADLSAGMLARARARVGAMGWSCVRMLETDVHALRADALGGEIDRLLVFLGLTAFPRWEAAFEHLWSLLRREGRCVVVDVHAPKPGFQGRMVNLIARADIRRETWKPLERLASDFVLRDLPSQREHGGKIFLATGIKR